MPPNDDFNFSLDDAYLNFDLRDSFLQRYVTPNASFSEKVTLKTDDYETVTQNIWRSKDNSIYPNSAPYYSGSSLDFDYKVSTNFDACQLITILEKLYLKQNAVFALSLCKLNCSVH